MPVLEYRPHWPRMRAFALPSFYDGQVRINLAGRERDGLVKPEDYSAACDHVEALVNDCRDAQTGEPVALSIERTHRSDPYAVGPTEADLMIVWRNTALGFDHPRLGRIGPVPFRRPGGHTGGHGFTYLKDAGLPAGEYGVRSAFDLAPTIVELLGEDPGTRFSGRSLLHAGVTPK